MRRPTRKILLTGTLLIALPATAFPATYYHPIFDTKRGGSSCYYRTYSKAFLKKHPSVGLTTISVGRRSSVSDVEANSRKTFGLTFGATTKSEDYTALADCKPQGRAISCQVESDGGSFTIMRSGKGAIIKTRSISIEGSSKDLEIASKKGKPMRSFTLRGSGKQNCAAVFD